MAATRLGVLDACRGRDHELVQAKSSGNLVKSITAFKSLPRSLDADVEDSECLQWIALLVQEVVSRVEHDFTIMVGILAIVRFNMDVSDKSMQKAGWT